MARRSSTAPSGWQRSGASDNHRAGARERVRLGVECRKLTLQPFEDRQIDLTAWTSHNPGNELKRSLDAGSCDRLCDGGRHGETHVLC